MSDDSNFRVIDAGAAPNRYARGWHCLGLADTFRDGKPHALRAFGTDLVVFAGDDGKLNVLNGFCPHMGGNLADGTIKGNSLACPFHDWRWGGSGRCTGIPYARRVPPLARTKAWRTTEENRQLFVWHDPEGNPPSAEVAIPHLVAAFSEEWSDWTWKSLVVDTNCRELIDNVVDMAHFFYVHLGMPTYFKNIFEGETATQIMTSVGRADIGGATAEAMGDSDSAALRSEASYYGPAYMIDYLHSERPDLTLDGILINCHYPVTPNRFVLQYGTIVKLPIDRPRAEAEQLAADFAGGLGVGFEQDIAIWQTKTRINNPLLCEEDGPVYQLRRWYDQFYTNAAEISEEMTARFEFEVDTTRAQQAWRAEVAENIARRHAAARA